MAIAREIMPTDDLEVKAFMERMNVGIDNEITNQNKNLSAINGDLESLVPDVADLQIDVAVLKTKVALLESDVDNINGMIDAMFPVIQAHDEQIGINVARLDEHQQGILENTNGVKWNKEDIAAINEAGVELEARVTQNEANIQYLYDEGVAVTEQVNLNTQAIADLNAKVDGFHPPPP
ncbi:MAG: hypothetical protein DRQ58_09270 [Gammaproteobacteria bacterium]|nr:MAG: hypothetical protein DRQ58_09270 [Gammaproteobacteria bacterium]